jgi:hypothetical protein
MCFVIYLLYTPLFHSLSSIHVTGYGWVQQWTPSLHHNKIFKHANPMQGNTSFFYLSHVKFYTAPLEEQCHNSKNAHFELCPQEVCLRPYLPSGIASHVYFLKCPRQGRSVVVLLMRLPRPGHWFFLSPEKLYFSSCDSVLLGVRHILRHLHL